MRGKQVPPGATRSASHFVLRGSAAPGGLCLNGNTRYILHEAIFDLVGRGTERHFLVLVLLFSPQE